MGITLGNLASSRISLRAPRKFWSPGACEFAAPAVGFLTNRLLILGENRDMAQPHHNLEHSLGDMFCGQPRFCQVFPPGTGPQEHGIFSRSTKAESTKNVFRMN